MQACLFSEALLTWYAANARDLPWRGITDPYAIWVSEIMLQQTQVATVLPYYQRFLEAFPTIQALANAPTDAILKAWEGLGYYARVRNMQRAAQIIQRDFAGVFPSDIHMAESLPGIGKSTAGAILTFAYKQKHPLLDGNLKRVLARLFNDSGDIAQSKILKRFWEYSKTLLDATRNPYDFNQAMMELGATLCTPKNPQCLICPVALHCKAKAKGSQHQLPVKAKAKASPHFVIGVGIIWNHARTHVLIQKRPESGLLGGLWEFPGGKQEVGETLEKTVEREVTEELGIAVHTGERLAQIRHAYTHFKITLYAFTCQHLSGEPVSTVCSEWRWVKPAELAQYAFPKANQKLLKLIRADKPAKAVKPLPILALDAPV